ncbi:MAG: helix-turn-helix domain-containing protein [Rubrobacteraceae bacterium]
MEKLKELREARAFSLRELAKEAGVGHNTIYLIEHGQGNALPRTIRRLAKALGVEPRELMKGSG